MQQRNINIILRITVIGVFLARAWQCLRWSPAFSNLYYNPNGFGKVLEWYHGEDLYTILRDHIAEGGLLFLMKGSGVILLIAGIASIFYNTKRSWLKYLIWLGVPVLFFIFYGDFFKKHYNWGMLLEHIAQFTAPILFIRYVKTNNATTLNIWLKVTIAITFVCHGLFAVGYYLVPGSFTDMFIKGLGTNEPLAKQLLIAFGILDFIFAVLIFVPRLAKPALIYGVAWGFLTAMARIYTNYSISIDLENWFSQYWWEFFTRIPHFSFPLLIWLNITGQINRFPLRQPES